MVLSLLLRMYLPRLLGPEKIGQLFYAESISLIFFSFLPLGVSVYISRMIPPNPSHTKEILSSVLFMQFVYGLLIAGAMYTFLMFSGKDQATIQFTMTMGVFAGLHIINRETLKRTTIAIDEVKIVTIINIVTKLVLVGTAFLLLYFDESVESAIYALVLSEVFCFILLMTNFSRKKLVSLSIDFSVLRAILKVGLPFYAANVLAAVSTEIDMAMLGSLTSSEELGYFGAASKLVGIFLLFVPILSSSVTPALSVAFSKDKASFIHLTQQAIRFLLIITFPLSMAMTLFAGEFATILYGDGFEPSHKIIAYLSPVLLLTYLATLLSSALSISKTGKTLATVIFVGVLINVSLNSFTVSLGLAHWGVGGGGLAVTISTLISEVVGVCLLMRLFPGKLVNTKMMMLIVLLEVPAFLCLWFFDALRETPLVYRILGFGLTPLYLFTIGALKRSELVEMMKEIRRR